MLSIVLRALKKSRNPDDDTLNFVYSKMKRFESIYDIDIFGQCQREMIINCLEEYTTLNNLQRAWETLDFVENYFILN